MSKSMDNLSSTHLWSSDKMKNDDDIILETKEKEVVLTKKALIINKNRRVMLHKRPTGEIPLNQIAECHVETRPISIAIRLKDEKIFGINSIEVVLPILHKWTMSVVVSMAELTAYTQRWVDAINMQISKANNPIGIWTCMYCKMVNEGKFCSNCGSPRRMC